MKLLILIQDSNKNSCITIYIFLHCIFQKFIKGMALNTYDNYTCFEQLSNNQYICNNKKRCLFYKLATSKLF